MTNVEKILEMSSIPEGAEIKVSRFCELVDGKIIFVADEEVIGERRNNDPDGGRSIHWAATVKVDGVEFNFSFREKWWAGLECQVMPPGEDRFQDCDFPNWAVQKD